ncbi:MAG TPA: hypothetical protein PLW50_01040 [Smithellaceae bacterium]|nr:hypothetical protein [Smithellaceae bacterium]
MGEDKRWSVGTVVRLVEIANKLEALKEEDGVLSIVNKCVHLKADTFFNNFGTEGVKREMKSSTDIRCSVVIDGVEFAAWFDVPNGVKVITSEEDTETYVRLYDVDLKP